MKRRVVLEVVGFAASSALLLYGKQWPSDITFSSPQPLEVSREHEQEQRPPLKALAELSSEDVRTLVETAFGGLLRIDERVNPTQVTGDFNGDNRQDIGVAVRLAREIDKTSQAMPSFNLYIPIHTGLRAEDYKAQNRLNVLAYYPRRTHLAVLHGTTDTGFNNIPSEQKHVLINFPGIAPNRLKVFRGRVNPATAGDEPVPTPPPRLIADAVLADEVFEQGVGAIVYWDGSRYREYPVRSDQQ